MKISVVIPSYNSGRYLAATLNSIRRQEYSPIEVIVVDGGSTDETAEVVHAHEDIVSVYVSEKDRGQLDAVQKGLRLVSGDVVHWLNADDIVMPGTFAYVAEMFKRNTTTDIVYSDNFAFDEAARELYVGPTIRRLGFLDHCLYYRQMYSECVYWRASVTRYVEDKFLKLRVYTDYAFFINLRRGRRVSWAPKRLGAFRIVENQASARNKHLKREEYEFIRASLYESLGWSGVALAAYKALWAPVFFLRHFAYPKVDALARRLNRTVTGDVRRRQQKEAFFNEWLGRIESDGEVDVQARLFR